MDTATTRSSVPKTTARNARPASFSCPLPLRKAAAFIVTAVIAAGLLWAGSVEALAIHHKQSNNVPTGDPQKGKVIFESQGCNKCHGSLGEGLSTPGQKGGVPRIASTSLALSDFVQLVRHPKGQMPAFDSAKVSDSDLADVYAFLKSLAPLAKQETITTGDRKIGQNLYITDGCYECHGYQGQGATQTGGARLGPPQIPLSGFISYVREPSGQMPPYTSKVISDQELAHIYSFLQSVPKPPPSKTIPLLNQ
jgi:mono/diheme cytochrome c family protein